MPDVREVYEMVTTQKPPDAGSLDRQHQRQVRTSRNRRAGTIALVVAVASLIVAIGLGAMRDGADRTAVGPSPEPSSTDTLADLFLMDPESGERTPVLVEDGYQSAGEYSPNGPRLVYEQHVNVSGVPQLFVRESSGATLQLTHLAGGAYDPAWSPDGSEIAFSGDVDPASPAIFVIDADGTNQRVIARIGEARQPDWSPDGRSIVFSGTPSDRGSSQILVVSLADGHVRRLTDNDDPEQAPAWSPDGRWIAFERFNGQPARITEPHNDVWLIRPDGTGERRLQEELMAFDKWVPTWSPDGRQIAVAGALGGSYRTYVIDVPSGTWRPVDEDLASGLSWTTDGILLTDADDDSKAGGAPGLWVG
jgi:Tol biopolymer transport system component